MMPEPPPSQYRPPDPPPPSGPTPVYADDLYGPLRPPTPPIRVRLLKLVAALVLIFGGLIGSFFFARWAGWLEPVQNAKPHDTSGQNGIKSTIKYPVEKKAVKAEVNGGDPDAEWKRWVRSRLTEHDAKLTDHEMRIKALEERMKGTNPPAAAQAPVQAKPQPKPLVYRSMQFVSNKIEAKPVDDPDSYLLAPGATKLPCVTESAINSDIDGFFTVKLRNDIYDTATGAHLVIPQGSTVLGKYTNQDLLFGNERIPTVSMTLALPNGKSLDLGNAPVIDQKGQAGLSSRVDQHWARLFGSILIMGVLRGGQAALVTQLESNSATGAIASGIAGATNQAGQVRLAPALSTKPTVYVDPGEVCSVLLIKELKLPAYTSF